MIKKRITALITIVMMLTTLLPMTFIGGAQAAAVPPPKTKTLADFSGGSIPADITVKDRSTATTSPAVIDSSVGYDGGSSLAHNIDRPETHIIIPYRSEWKNYDTFNMRVYTEISNQKINIIINETAEASSGKDNGYWSKVPFTTDGTWQTLSVKIADLEKSWATKPPENIYILLNCTGWGLKTGTLDEFNAGTVNSVKGSKFHIDSVWLERTDSSGVLGVPTSSIENGAGWVDSALDGNNTLTMSFDKNLWDTDYSETVQVYDITGEGEQAASVDYEVSVNGTELKVVFDSALPTGDYKIRLDSENLWGVREETLNADYELIFSVGKGSVFFLPVSVSIEDGATDVDAASPDFTYSISFNNEIDNSDLAEKVTFTKDGEVYDDYEIICEDNTLTLDFANPLEGRCTYEITISEELGDVYGATLDSAISYSFTTARDTTYIGEDGIVFDARNKNDLEDGLLTPGRFKTEIVEENALLSDKTLKISYTAGVDSTVTMSPRLGDITDFKYINWLIYSPKADGEGMRLMIGTVRTTTTGDSYYLYTTKTDWAGWKVISVPVSSMSASRSPDKTQVIAHTVNFGGWNDKRSENGYILVDRIWYSNEEVRPLSLESTEYEYEEAYLPTDLGGDNAYSFTFDQELINRDYSELVSIYKYDGSEFVQSNSAFETVVDGKNLNVKFPSGLTSGDTYKITVDSSAIISSNASFGADEYETVFTVGTASPYFKVIGTAFAAASEEITSDTFTFEFNNEPVNSDIPDYISLYADGEKQYNAFTFKKEDKKLVLTFTKALEKGVNYTLKISDEYKDVFGNLITDAKEFDFDLGAASSTGDIVTVFSANNADDLSAGIARGDLTEETANTNLYSKTAKFSYTAGSDTSRHPLKEKTYDITGMKYMNAWVYSPKATGFPMGIIVYNHTANKVYVRTVVNVDWAGWKLITIDNSSIGNYSSIETINFNFGGWSTSITENFSICIDEIWFSKTKPSAVELESTSFPNGYTEAAISGEVLKLNFKSELNSVQNPEIIITDENGNTVSDYTADYSGSTMTLSFGTLASSTKYTVSINGLVGAQPVIQTTPIVLEFTTVLDGVFLKDIELNYDRIIADTEMTAVFNISNLSQTPAALKLVLTASDEDNRLLAAARSDYNAASGDTMSELKIVCPEGTKELTAYVLDNQGRLLSKKYVKVTSDGTQTITPVMTDGSNPGVKIESAEINVNVLEIKGKASAVTGAVMVEIKGRDVISSNIVEAEQDGSFVYYYVFPADAETLTYTVNVSADGKAASKNIVYISKADRDELLSLANGSSASAFEECVADIRDVIGLGDVTDEELKDIASITIDQDDFGTYSEVISFITRVADLLDEINAAKWSSLAAIILSNTDILGEDDDAVEYFEGLKEKGRNKICEILIGKLPASSISDFMDKLSDSVDEYKKSLDEEDDKKSNTGSAGGGGGGKATSSVIYPTGTAGVTPYTPIEANNVFTDLSEALWATESIMTLYKEGIVSYPTDGRYRPNDKITREEFVKMVVCAFINNTAYSAHRFTDEAAGAWYNEYLAKAYAAGVATGYPDGRFGIGENITREDMVTICARTLEALGENMTSAYDGGFADSALISDYAVEYVGAMTQTGVINGMGDGTFAPKANATRAEAAKVIARLIELY